MVRELKNQMRRATADLNTMSQGFNSSSRELNEKVIETLEEATAIILEADRQRKNPETNGGVVRVVSDDITIKSGKYGNYIQYQGKTNVALGKKYTAQEITEAECLKLISEKKKKYK